MTDRTPTGRRLTFSLRTLFALVTLVAIGVCWMGLQLRSVRDRRAMQIEIMHRGGLVGEATSPDGSQAGVPWVRRLLGDRPIASITLSPTGFSEEDGMRIKRMFPEASVKELNIYDGAEPHRAMKMNDEVEN